MGKPTPEELAQLRDAIKWKADKGEDTSGIEAIVDLATGNVPGPEEGS